MTEPAIMLLLVAGVGLWMLGGWHWKGWRRYVWPVVLAGTLLRGGVGVWPAVGTLAGTVAVNSLPYGDRTPWWLRVLVFASYALPAAALDWRVALGGSAVMAVALTGAMVLSRRWNRFTWKVWEGLAGFCQAAVLVVAAL